MPEPPREVGDDAERAFGPWIRGARCGSAEAMGQALESCRAYLLLVANRELDDDLRAKGGPSDLVQETFLEAQRDFAHFGGQTAAELRAWLRQILLHNLANFARAYRATGKRQVTLEVTPVAGGSTLAGLEPATGESSLPERNALAAEEAEALEAALRRLPDDYRRVISCRHQQGLSFADIARRLDRSENATRKLWFRAVERLKQELRPTAYPTRATQ